MSRNYLMVNQRPVGFSARSPLADVDRSSFSADPGVSIVELSSLGFLILRTWASQKSVIEAKLGCELPVEPLSSIVAGDLCVRWLSPTEWLITLPEEETATMEDKLRSGLGDEVAVVDNSGGYACIHLMGPMSELVIRKSTSYDVHPSNFPRGKVVGTSFAQSQAILRRLCDTKFEMIFRRSFADYIWRWLVDAAGEYGLELKENSTYV